MPLAAELLETLIAQGLSFKEGNNDIRSDLLATLQSLQYELETPQETFFRIAWGQVSSCGRKTRRFSSWMDGVP